VRTKDVCVLLKKKREQFKVTQRQVASLIGCSRVSVCQWETGKALPPLEPFLALLNLYDMKIEESIQGNKND
jgi:transcriptional regulator with XRE-family HTH domain